MSHGHVKPNPDGSVARCGGPALCSVCAKEQALAYAAGEEAYWEMHPMTKKLKAERDRYREVLCSVYHQGVCAGELKDRVQDALWPGLGKKGGTQDA
jgi:hypothetical protein